MSRNIIIAVAVIGTLTLCAATQERRPEIVTASQPAFTAVKRKLSDDEPPHVSTAGVSAGQITREQGEFASGKRYQVAIMQFQLFSALHTMLAADIARTPAVATEPTPSRGGETVLVAMPFSSLQLNPSLVEYLGLNPTQVRSIQGLMDQERPKAEVLMLELRTISAELGVAIRQSQNNDNEGAAQKLAATQARLLKQLMRANLRLQRRIDEVLDPQQRKKLDAFKRTGEVTIGDGNQR